MKKHWREICFLLPSFAVAIAAAAGLKMNVMAFPPITYPKEAVQKGIPNEIKKRTGQQPAPNTGTGPTDEAETVPDKNTKGFTPAKRTVPPGNNLKKAGYTPTSTWKDGTYIGSGTGFGGTITVKVTISGGKIIDIRILSAEGETPSYLERAKEVIPRMAAAQSPDVDMVSGATYSSNGIRTAVIQALNQAGASLPAEPKTAPAPVPVPKPSPQASKAAEQTPVTMPSITIGATDHASTKSDSAISINGQIKDGTYQASALVIADEWEEFEDYNLTADVTFSNGKLTAITNLVPEDKANEGYCNMAAKGYGTKKGIIQQLINKQDSNVDAVSGATCSSRALVQIYKNALKAAKKEG